MRQIDKSHFNRATFPMLENNSKEFNIRGSWAPQRSGSGFIVEWKHFYFFFFHFFFSFCFFNFFFFSFYFVCLPKMLLNYLFMYTETFVDLTLSALLHWLANLPTNQTARPTALLSVVCASSLRCHLFSIIVINLNCDVATSSCHIMRTHPTTWHIHAVVFN